MKDVEEDLIRKRKTLDRIKTEKTKKEGQYDQLMKQLKEEFEIDSLEAANKEIKSLSAKEENQEEELKEAVEKLEADYEWE